MSLAKKLEAQVHMYAPPSPHPLLYARMHEDKKAAPVVPGDLVHVVSPR